jgi:hypothetical protein
MFHSDYKHIINRLPESLVKRACERLLYHFKDPIPLESISGKSKRIESYLRHSLEIYENSLNRKRKNMTQKKLLRSRSWSECNVFLALPYVCVLDSEVQTESIPYNHKEENNHRVMNELKVLSHYLPFFLMNSKKRKSIPPDQRSFFWLQIYEKAGTFFSKI